MDYSEVLERTYTLSFTCPCEGCLKKLKKINGVVRLLEVNKDEDKVTISATVDIQTIISELKRKHKKVVKLLSNEESRVMDKLVNLQIVPAAKQPVQNVALRQPAEFMGVVVRAPNFVVENNYGSYSRHEHNGSYSRHEHKLQLKTYNKRFSCNKCREDGCGSRYECNDECDYELHLECKNPKAYVTHDLFKGRIFELRNYSSNADSCNACGKNIYGLFYYCEENGFCLHPRCANLKSKIYNSGKCFVLHKKASIDCLWCKKKEVSGTKSWSYVCDEDEKCCFHVHCVMEMVQEAWRKSGLQYKDDVSMALATIGTHNTVVSKEKNKGKIGGFLKILSIFFKAIVAVLLGDPTALLASVLVELLK